MKERKLSHFVMIITEFSLFVFTRTPFSSGLRRVTWFKSDLPVLDKGKG